MPNKTDKTEKQDNQKKNTKRKNNDDSSSEEEQDQTKFHPYSATNSYLEQHKPLKFITENVLKNMKYGTMIKLC